MDPSSISDEQILEMLSTDSPLLTPPSTSPAPGSNNNDSTERQVTTRVIVRGPAQNAYVTVPESSSLLRDENNLPALMVNDTLPITNPRPFYASPYEKLPKSLEYNDFRSVYFPDIKRPDYHTTLQVQWTNIFTHVNE